MIESTPLPNLCHSRQALPAPGTLHDCDSCGRRVSRDQALACRVKGPVPEISRAELGGPCFARSAITRSEECSCGAVVGKRNCWATGKECVMTNRDRELVQLGTVCENCTVRPAPRRKWITLAEQGEDAVRLAGMLAGRCTSVIGVARSGLVAATAVAMLLHVPLVVLRENERDLISCGHGWRLGSISDASKLDLGESPVVIDDTTCSGGSAENIRSILDSLAIVARFAVIYYDPLSRVVPDVYVRELQRPHVLQWNIGNSVYTDHMVWDMDGVICEDCPPEYDDDGRRYLDWLRHARPLCLPRRSPITIATGRREQYRRETMAWLLTHGVKVAGLHMHSDGERSGRSIVDHKIAACREFIAARPGQLALAMLESDPRQAVAIESAVGLPVFHC